MMKFNQPLYFCTECKTIVQTLDQLLFVEEHSNKGFCSEACIEDFYHPLINHFLSLEIKSRKAKGISEEMIFQKKDDKDLVEEVLNSPSEIWKIENELNEALYSYIRHFQDYSAIVICSVYNQQASFIFFKTVTRSREFLQEFRLSKKENARSVETDGQGEEMNEEDFQFMQLLESKKSKLLADLLVKRKDNDISFEEFTLYESCFQECLETPDEVFEKKDNEGDVFFVYIKSFIRDGQNLFYIISCLKKNASEGEKQVSVFPVLGFPTNDMDLYLEFRSGTKRAGPLKN